MSKKQVYLNTLIIELLHKMPMFSMFSEKEIRRMLYSGELVQIQKYKPGVVIIQEGAYGKWVYILLRGAVKVVKKGVEICTLRTLGDVIGEIGAVKTMPRSASVIAVDNAVCLAINLEVIEQMSGSDKEEYLNRINTFFTPLIESRLQRTLEIEDLLAEIQEKRLELLRLQQRLKDLGASEEKPVLQLISEKNE